jgi:thioredoxin-like negative regulator of GroEL
MKKSVKNQLAFLVSGLLVGASACAAADSNYDKAVATYLGNDYKKALPMFQAVSKSDPKNAKVHYYLALCHQGLDDDKNAAAEYQLALDNNKDSSFKEIIDERLARTKRRLAHAKAADEAPAPEAKKHDPVHKVIWFSTNWCSTCKRFEPSWEKGKTAFKGKLDFQHLNAEDPANWKVVEKYRPKAYPTLVFLDSKDKVIQNYADAPEADAFIKHLKELGAN